MELLKNDVFQFFIIRQGANVIANSLSPKPMSMGYLLHFNMLRHLLAREVQNLTKILIRLHVTNRGGFSANVESRYTFLFILKKAIQE